MVFNAEQIDGLPPLQIKTPDWDRHERAESVLQASGVEIRHDQPDRAFYRPATDRIHLPIRDSFPSADTYYGTALHELGHWTGTRPAWTGTWPTPSGSVGYAKEELRAEIASLMVGDQPASATTPASTPPTSRAGSSNGQLAITGLISSVP